MKSEAFKSSYQTLKVKTYAGSAPAAKIDIADYSTLWDRDRVGWCLFDIDEDRQVWKVLQRLNSAAKTTFASDMALGSTCFPLENFRMPQGKKDLERLAQSDRAHHALTKLW